MNWHRVISAAAILLLVIGGEACVMVSTVQPLHTEKDRVTDPALEGVWSPVVHNAGVIDKMEITFDKALGYSLMPAADAVRPPGGGKPPEIAEGAVIFKLGPHYMMELGHLGFGKDQQPKREDRYFGKIAMIDGRIFVAMPNGALVEGMLKEHPELVKNRITEGGGGNPGSVTPTDSTENERAFILKAGRHFFTYPLEAYRRPKAAKAAASTRLQTKEQETFEVMWLMWAHLRAIGEDGAFESVRTGLEEPGDAAADNPMELMPALDLPESACDGRVGRLYRDVRDALMAVRKSKAKVAEPFPYDYLDPEKNKANAAKRVEVMTAFDRDPLGTLAGQLPKDHPQREVLAKLAKRLEELTAEIEKTYDVKLAAGK